MEDDPNVKNPPAEPPAFPASQAEKTFTQTEVDRIMKERLAREGKKDPPAQDAPPAAPTPPEPDPALVDAQNELQIARAQLEAVKEGVRPDCVEDAVFLAVRKCEKDGKPGNEAAMKEALAEVLKRHPDWKVNSGGQQQAGFRVGAGGATTTEADSYETQLADARKSGDTVRVLQIKRDAAKKGIILN